MAALGQAELTGTQDQQDGAAITDLFSLAWLSKQENTLPSSPKEATRNDST